MQITVPSNNYCLATSKGQQIPLGARVDVVTGNLKYTNARLSSITIGVGPYSKKPELEGIDISTDGLTKRCDKSMGGTWEEWADDYQEIYIDDLDEIVLHTVSTEADDLYELTTHGLSKDEFIERLRNIVKMAKSE